MKNGANNPMPTPSKEDKNIRNLRARSFAFALLKVGGFVNRKKAAHALRIARKTIP